MMTCTFTADDFGLSIAVNEAVEHAHRHGVLDAASLMVAGPAAEDAVRRAKTFPSLRVGLHLVVIEGRATLPHAAIPDLADAAGWIGSDQMLRAVAYAFHPQTRRQLAAEIEAQFAAYAATGLPLDHADAHKHMHLHPTVGRLMIESGLRHGLRRVRVPSEPPAVMEACGERVGLGARALYQWSRVLRRQVRRAGLQADDQVFGLAWSGGMTPERVLRLLAHLPRGSSELYFHPASRRDPEIERLMPGYDHGGELAALVDTRLREWTRQRRVD